MTRTQKHFLLLMIAGGCIAGAPAPATQPAPPAQTTTIKINDFHFDPQSLTVASGSSVTWVNHDDVPHTATANGDSPLFDSKALDTDEHFTFTFITPGTYTYYCKVHPHMTGTIIVK
jgi:plastocyanin